MPSVQMRVARHKWFMVWVLCMGCAVAGTVEALVAHFITPWWLQVSASLMLSMIVFGCGRAMFGSSHNWVVRDPRLEPPLWAIDVCVVS